MVDIVKLHHNLMHCRFKNPTTKVLFLAVDIIVLKQLTTKKLFRLNFMKDQKQKQCITQSRKAIQIEH
jgi:hypothetical protein